MTLPVIVIGAGGHASVVADALLASGRVVLGFTDPAPARHDGRLCGLPVLGDDDVLAHYSPNEVELANGMGSLGGSQQPLRRRVQEMLEGQGWRFCSVVHPSAVVSPFAHLGASVQLMACCIVQPGATVGRGAVVNTGAVIEHDAKVGIWSHIAPRALLCGNTEVGAVSHVGAGAVVRQGVVLGPTTLIGAGAVVVRNFAGDGTLVGIPAQELERKV